MAPSGGASSARAAAARYAWLHDSVVQAAGCLTVASGLQLDVVAEAFGIDPRGPVQDPAAVRPGALASIVAADGATVVVEDLGLEGARDVVMRAASRGGRAASVSWDVESMVVVTCASRGAVVFIGEIDALDGDEREGLPRGLGRFVDLAQEDDADVLAIGAAMVAAYVGIDIGPEVVDERWRVVVPLAHELDHVTPDTPALSPHEPDVLLALTSLPAGRRRQLTRQLVAHAAARASLDRDPDLAQVLASVSDTGPGTVTSRFVDRERRASNAMDAVRDSLIDGDEVEHRERSHPVARAHWLITALRHACSPDDLAALLGVVECSRVLHALDELETAYLGYVRRACTVPPSEVPSVLASLGTPPDADERRRSRAERRAQRKEREQGRAAPALPQTDARPLLALDRLADGTLREVATAVAEELLAATGLLDRPWLQQQRAALGTPLTPEEAGDVLAGLFVAMDDDPGVVWTTRTDDRGDRVSLQHFALPVVTSARRPDASAAAASAITTAYDALGPDASALVVRVRTRLGLEQGR